MDAYLFVHFKELDTPDGEQVYFALSTDGFRWEQTNGGRPVLESTVGERGVRDHTIVRTKQGTFRILSTDLSLARHFRTKYAGRWENIARFGSRSLVMWESEDLIRWSEPRLLALGDGEFGCLWAPDVVYDAERDDYVVHWSSSHASNDYGPKAIYYSRTPDFETFSEPRLLCRKPDGGIIDSAIYEENGRYYRFLKSEANPAGIILEQGSGLAEGEYERVEAFDAEMAKLDKPGAYEAPTAFRLNDGRWCLMIDYFGVQGAGQGYVPYVADALAGGRFVRSDESFRFPYGFKHGTVLPITREEYERIRGRYPNEA